MIVDEIREIYTTTTAKKLREDIEKHFIPTNEEKKQNAEVSTPVKLVDEMLDVIPFEFWKKPKKVFEPYSTYTNKNDLITYIKSNENNTSNAIVSQIKEYKFTREKLDKEKVCLVKGDCLEVMLNIEPKSIDLILCDLPYGVTKNKWDVIISFEKLWEQYNRIIKDNGAIVLFGSQPFTTMLISSNMKYFRYSLVWEKNKFSDFLNAKRKPMKTNEDICIFYKKQPTYNIQYWYSTPYHRWNTQKAVDKQTNYGSHKSNVVESDGKRLPTTVLKFNRVERPSHPTQKPVDLLEWLIKSYTNEGDTVLDNCMGVGSTGVASKKNNRNFIGIELDETYYNQAVEFI